MKQFTCRLSVYGPSPCPDMRGRRDLIRQYAPRAVAVSRAASFHP